MRFLSHLRDAARRHAHLADATIAVTVLAATMATTFTGQPMTGAGSRAVALGCAAIACGALAIRRLQPVAVLVITATAAELMLAETGNGDGVLILLAPCIALYTVAEQVERRPGRTIAGCVVAALAIAHPFIRPSMLGHQDLAFAAIGGLAIAAGDAARHRRAYLAEAQQRALRAEQEREADTRRRVAQERLRIARDLHDSVGHHLALISVQSDVATATVESDAAGAREALAHVKSASKKALEELRDTVSLLRQAGDPVAPTEVPAPGLEALDDLLAGLRASGLAVDHQVAGTPVALAPATDLTAYRVVQESLTNVRKHSSQQRARLTLSYDRNDLSIAVDDLGRGGERGIAFDHNSAGDHESGPSSGGRHGILGMRERVQAIGGQLTAGPRPGGGFRVRATLPYTAPLNTAPLNTAPLNTAPPNLPADVAQESLP
jgi:signal transduction histidine kinase